MPLEHVGIHCLLTVKNTYIILFSLLKVLAQYDKMSEKCAHFSVTMADITMRNCMRNGGEGQLPVRIICQIASKGIFLTKYP